VIVAAAASRERLDAQRPRAREGRWNALSDTTANGSWRAIVVFNNFAAIQWTFLGLKIDVATMMPSFQWIDSTSRAPSVAHAVPVD
jgi:hypothetical protein